jgi:hypothetical protein
MKRRLAVVFAILIGALTVGVAFASGGDGSDNNPIATIWAGKGDCGSPITAPFTDIGFVNFHRVGNTVSLNVHLKNGQPNATYNVFLFGDGCTPIDGNLGTVITNSQGVGNGNVETTVPAGFTQFFADPTTQPSPFIFPSNDTTTVTLDVS